MTTVLDRVLRRPPRKGHRATGGGVRFSRPRPRPPARRAPIPHLRRAPAQERAGSRRAARPGRHAAVPAARGAPCHREFPDRDRDPDRDADHHLAGLLRRLSSYRQGGAAGQGGGRDAADTGSAADAGARRDGPLRPVLLSELRTAEQFQPAALHHGVRRRHTPAARCLPDAAQGRARAPVELSVPAAADRAAGDVQPCHGGNGPKPAGTLRAQRQEPRGGDVLGRGWTASSSICACATSSGRRTSTSTPWNIPTPTGRTAPLPMARALGARVTVIDNTVYEKGTIHARIAHMMQDDILGFRGPPPGLSRYRHWRYRTCPRPEHRCAGECPHGGPAGIFRSGILFAARSPEHHRHRGSQGPRQARAFVKNLQLSDAYLEDTRFQGLTAAFFAHTAPQRHPPIRCRAPRGVLRGMISHQFPNVLSRAAYPLDQVVHLDREVDLFKHHIGRRTARMALDMMRYLTYIQISAKRVTTFPLPQGVRPLFFAMSGPLASYHLGRPRTLIDASQPKREIYAHTRHRAGFPYRKLPGIGRGILAAERASRDLLAPVGTRSPVSFAGATFSRMPAGQPGAAAPRAPRACARCAADRVAARSPRGARRQAPARASAPHRPRNLPGPEGRSRPRGPRFRRRHAGDAHPGLYRPDRHGITTATRPEVD